jgi:protein phosphatase
LVRPFNEDSFLVARFRRSLHAVLTNLLPGLIPDSYAETGYVMLVADGMGGMAGGEAAGRTAISTLVELFIRTPDWVMRTDGGNTREVLRRMEERFGRLTDALTERAEAEPYLSGMGTTLTMAASLGDDLVIAHVGASRAYVFRRGHLLRLTSDQTVAQELADAGVIRPEEVATHHARRMLTGAITAGGKRAEVELHHARLADGDKLLLCSDGLTEMVAEGKISEALERRAPAAAACRELIDMALKAGGRDNVTAVLAVYRIPDERDLPVTDTRSA